MTKIFKW